MTYKQTAHDFNIRYGNVWAAIRKKDGMLEPIRIANAEDKEGGEVILYISKWNGETHKWEGSHIKTDDESLFLNYPNLGAINLSSGFVVLLTRQCKRFFREMPHNDASQIIDPFKGERQHISDFLSENYSEEDTVRINTNVESHGIGHYQFLKDVYNNQYFTGPQAVREILDGRRIGAAINGDWYIGITHTSDTPLLFKKEYAVAELIDNVIFFPRSLKFLKEEASTLGLEVRVR